MQLRIRQVQIRQVEPADAAPIAALLNEIIRDGRFTSMADVMTDCDQREFIRSLPPRGLYLAAADLATGRIVGVQDILPLSDSGESATAEISTFVALDQTGRGIGRALSEAMFAAAVRLGYRTLTAIIRGDNRGAIAFYERLGFTIVDRGADSILIDGRAVNRVRAEMRLAPSS